MDFGTILRETRVQQGLDLATVARRLRIRPDILEAIEAGNLDGMPPRGYARNMVNAYARYLGLNPTEITRMYLDESYAHQMEVVRARPPQAPAGFDLPGTSRFRHMVSRDDGAGARYPSRQGQNAERTLYVDERNQVGYSRRQQAEAQRRNLDARARRSQRRGVPEAGYTNYYIDSQPKSRLRSGLPFIIAGVVIMVLLIVILVLLFGPKGEESAGGTTPTVPVTGDLEDGVPAGSVSDDGADSTNTPVKRAPTEFVFSFSVAEGETTWVEVLIDEVMQYAGSMTGDGNERTYTSSGKLHFITANASLITATLDGQPYTIQPSETGGADFEIDFAWILEQWNIANPPAAGTGAEGTAGTEGGDAGSDSGNDASGDSSDSGTGDGEGSDASSDGGSGDASGG